MTPQEIIESIDGNFIPEEAWMEIVSILDLNDLAIEQVGSFNGNYFLSDQHQERVKKLYIERTMDEAMEYIEEPAADMAEEHYDLGVEYFIQGRIDEAELEFNVANQLDPQPKYSCALASLQKNAITDPSMFGKECERCGDNLYDVSVVKMCRSCQIVLGAEREKAIVVIPTICDACHGPYHTATGHAFYIGSELKGVGCGPCATEFFYQKMERDGWQRKYPLIKKKNKTSKQQRKENKRLIRQKKEEYKTNRAAAKLALVVKNAPENKNVS